MATENLAFKLVGQTIGGCQIKKLIGTGGMGAVYLAHQLSLGKEVALKVLDEKWSRHARHVEGFLREARLAAKLEDEHIVQIYDVGTDGRHHFIVMQLARGENLKDRLRRGALEVEEALKYIEGIARGLALAHRHNIVHRDIKPGNLVIGEDGIVKILDFGLAKLEEAESDKSQGQFMGSIAYMSPEQSEYMPIDARTDIYSLGITAWQCLAGQMPFRGENNFDLIVKHHTEEPLAPSVIRREVPLTLSRVVLRMLGKNPADRYATVDDLLLDLKLIRRHQLPAAPSPWGKRPLNPEPVDLSGHSSEQLYKNALEMQRELFGAGKQVVPMRELLPKMGLKPRAGADAPLTPATFLELRCGDKRMPLAGAARYGFAPPECEDRLYYGERFRIGELDGRVIVRVRGPKPLGIVDVQRLFDLLEALPATFKQLAVALDPDYSAQGSDIRWVVDTYNLLDKRGCQFTLIVGSMENHTTFVNLGIDSHIRLELELERTQTVSLERLTPQQTPLPAAPELPAPLTPSANALVAQIESLLQSGNLVEAARNWRRLVSEGLERRQLANLDDLRKRLYDRLLDDGREAMEADDHDTATERFNTLIDLDPGRHEGHFYKGLLLKSEGKLEYAQAFLTQAILAAPDEAELFYHRAIVRSRVDDLEGALRDLDMALQHNPRLVAAYYNRAKVHHQMGRDDLAKRDMLMYQRLKGGTAKSSRAGATPEAE
ncbi:MAG: protein kinase [Planctomycetes bacterium]|jgi:tetratricopeptide (TPR) repeat protein|nr:protein kinase [Planctomycetota bacterium]MCL4730904.1 protein kinase [Planctomycetota bacterium]